MYEIIEKIKERRENKIENRIEREQIHLLDGVHELDVTTEEYQKAIACMDHLTKAKETETRKKVSADTILILLTQIISLGGVMIYTKKDLLPRDAMPFWHKIKGRL